MSLWDVRLGDSSAFASEVAQVTLLLPVTDKGAMTGLASVLVECGVYHLDMMSR